ncbi:hypothetical protein ACQEV4_01435 [Streptomyces shenzhenensis]|uniref:hypothetical protein n=1 Tax=Streptomyces shenzhenensis TaxID=943815 RepID=UPI003D8E5487
MSTQTELPPRWHATVWPEGWDFEKDHYPDPQLKQVGWILLPERFHMVVHWPELDDGKSEHGGACIVGFEVLDGGLEVREIYGLDMDLEQWIGHLVVNFPPQKWKQYASVEITRLLASPKLPEAMELPEGLAWIVSKSVRKGIDSRKESASGVEANEGRKRHRITAQHLEEVASVYAQASKVGEPPTRAVAEHFSVAHSTAAKWVGKARQAGLLKALRPKEEGEDYAKVTGHD